MSANYTDAIDKYGNSGLFDAYLGDWNASTNTPVIVNGTGSNGQFYRVSTAGTWNSVSFRVGDAVVYNSTLGVWEKLGADDLVTSVNGQTGPVSLTTTDIPEGTNKYFTSSLALGTSLAGLSTATTSTITSTDTILTALGKLQAQITNFPKSWNDYASMRDVDPVLLTTVTTPVAGDVYSYTWNSVTRYRLVPTNYNYADDAFYSSFTSGVLSGKLVDRNDF